MSALIKSLKTLGFNNAGIFVRSLASANIPTFETLAVSVPKKYVYHVELNRPKKLNAFNTPMWSELAQCFEMLSNATDCRAVVLSAQGKLFSSGIDINRLIELSQQVSEVDDVARKARVVVKAITYCQAGVNALELCAKPVLTVVHGACIGAGVDLITAADIRYCTADAWFQVKEVDVGLAADVGTLQRLPKVIGSASIARELCLTARKVDANEALSIGLVSKVYPDKDTAVKSVIEVAENIASKSPVAVQGTKQSMVYSQSRTTEEGLDHIVLLNQCYLQSDDLAKSAVAQMSKEPADYDDY